MFLQCSRYQTGFESPCDDHAGAEAHAALNTKHIGLGQMKRQHPSIPSSRPCGKSVACDGYDDRVLIDPSAVFGTSVDYGDLR